MALIDGKPIYSELDQYYRLCHMTACRASKSFGVPQLYDELTQQAVIKALECLERYEPDKDIKCQFWSFADHRVKGHIIDCIRYHFRSRNKNQLSFMSMDSTPDILKTLTYSQDFELMCDMQTLVIPKRERTAAILEEAIVSGHNRKTAEKFGVTESRVCQIVGGFRRDNPDVFT